MVPSFNTFAILHTGDQAEPVRNPQNLTLSQIFGVAKGPIRIPVWDSYLIYSKQFLVAPGIPDD